MKITNVTVGKSVQVFQIGQPEYWHKVTFEAIVEETDSVENVVDELFKEVNAAHDKYSQTIVDFPFTPPPTKATITELKKEFNVKP